MSINIIKSDKISSIHGFSTRTGGVSTGIFSSLNLGMKRGDENDNVILNYHMFFDKLGIKDYRFVCGNQVHGNYVHVATKEDLRLPMEEGKVIEADGFVTNIPGLPIVVFTADCVPVLLEDAKNKVIGAVHCGWRSTVKDIEKEAIDKLLLLGADINNIHIAIGPAICEKCFEVGQEVIDEVNQLLCDDDFMLYTLLSKEPSANAKYLLNLRGVIERRFTQLGVNSNNIDILPNCTMCEPDLFWSHRYTKGQRGSQANIIML